MALIPTPDDIEHRLSHHVLNDHGARLISVNRSAAKAFAAAVLAGPAGREQSLAVTKLEEALFWANAAVARHPGYQEHED